MGLISRLGSTAASVLLASGLAVSASAAEIELHGASQFNDTHAFNKALLKFEEETKACYAKPVKFVLHRNSELGLEKEYFNFMIFKRQFFELRYRRFDRFVCFVILLIPVFIGFL